MPLTVSVSAAAIAWATLPVVVRADSSVAPVALVAVPENSWAPSVRGVLVYAARCGDAAPVNAAVIGA